MKTKLNARRLALNGVLIAMYVVLNFFSIKTGNYKFTFDAFPLIVAGVLFGPLTGTLVGFVGSFIYQLFFSGYGITATTVLWMLAPIARGFLLGMFSKLSHYEPKTVPLILATVFSGLVVTSLNTLALYVDSLVFGYYSYAFVFGLLVPKYITSIIIGVVFALIVPGLVKKIRKNIKLPVGE